MKRQVRLQLLTLCAVLGTALNAVHAHPGPAETPADAVICVGDCDLDGTVKVGELVEGVNGALGQGPVPPRVDANGDGAIGVNELVMAIGYALGGCPPARFVDADCEVTPPAGQDAERVRCGYLIVPEYRPPRDGRTYQIAAMVVPATGPERAPDPVVYVDGGPGYRTLDNVSSFHTAEVLAPLLAHHDLIYFDPRGVGRSRPSTDCPEIDQAILESFGRNQSAATDAADVAAAGQVCRDRLVAMGVDLDSISSAAIVRDIDDLTAALGYDEYNLFGTSYGARITLTAVRDVPARLRSVVVDVPVPIDAHLVAEQARNSEDSLGRLLAACRSDPSCDAAYPALGEMIDAVAAQLEAAPLTRTIVDPAGMPRPFVLTSDRFLLMTTAFLGAAEFIGILPAFVADVAAGGSVLTDLSVQGYAAPSQDSWGMYNSMWCYEHVAFLTPEIIAAANTGVSDRRAQLYLDSSVQPAIDACPTWRTSVPPALEHEAVHSDIPTLILTGQFDPLTPPRYGEHIAATLSRGQSIELPNKSHLIVDGGGCGMQLASAFFDDPAAPVDTACFADIAPIEFTVP